MLTSINLTIVLDKKSNFYASLGTVCAEATHFFAPFRSISTGFRPDKCFERGIPGLLRTNGLRWVLALLQFLFRTHVKLKNLPFLQSKRNGSRINLYLMTVLWMTEWSNPKTTFIFNTNLKGDDCFLNTLPMVL